MKEIKPIDNLDELNKVIEESAKNPVIIFKHSSTCPISAKAKTEVDTFAKDCSNDGPSIYQVIVQDARQVSNQIALQLEITHCSPQVIVVSNGKACYDCSHFDITKDNLSHAIKKL